MSLEGAKQIIQCQGNIWNRLWLSFHVKWPWDLGIFTFLPFSLSREAPPRNIDLSLPVQAMYDTGLSLYQNIVVTLGFGVKIEAGWKEVSWGYNLTMLSAEKRALKCLNKGLVLKVLVTFAASKILATKCDVLQGTDSFWNKLGCMRLLNTEGWERNCDSGSNFFYNNFPLGVKRKLF